MNIEKVNISEAFTKISTYWDPKIAGALNDQYVKLAKFKDTFPWHKHDDEDEMFLVIEGEFTMEFRDRKIELKPNEFLIVPKGVEHRPVALNEASVLLFEPKSTLNTGDSTNDFTKHKLDTI